MAKKGGKVHRAARKAMVAAKRYTPRGGRLMSMFKTAFAVSAAALVGGVALNVANSAREKPAEGVTAGVFTFGAGALLAFALGLFKGTKQYVTPVLAGATAVGALSAFNGPISRGSANLANALLGRKAGEELALGAKGGTGTRGTAGPAGVPAERRLAEEVKSGAQVPAAGMKSQSKGQQLIGLANTLAGLGASIAGAIGGGQKAASPVGAAAGDGDTDGSEGLSDFNIRGGGDDMEGSEGLDDYAIVGSAMMGDD